MLKTEIDRYYTDDNRAIFDRNEDCIVGCVHDGTAEARIYGDRVFMPKNKPTSDDNKSNLIQAMIGTIQKVEGDGFDLMLIRGHWSDGCWGAIVGRDGSFVEEVRPMIGSTGRRLGVRVPPAEPSDVSPDEAGNVAPDTQTNRLAEGMSVAPELALLYPHRIPERLAWLVPGARGPNQDRVFRLGDGPFTRRQVGQSLELVPDPGLTPRHGVVQPASEMNVETFRGELAATQARWIVDEPEEP